MVGLHVPAASAGQLPTAAEYIEFFKQAESMGYHALWTEDRVFHDANFLEPLTPFIRDYYGPAMDIAQHGVYGPPGEVAKRLRAFADAGVRTFMLRVPTLDIGHIERIDRDVVPKVRG